MYAWRPDVHVAVSLYEWIVCDKSFLDEKVDEERGILTVD